MNPNRFQARRAVEMRQFDGKTVSPTQVARFRKLIRFAKERSRRRVTGGNAAAFEDDEEHDPDFSETESDASNY